MKIKDGYILREVADNYVVVPVGPATLDFSGMLTLNGTGAFLWRLLLAEERTREELLAALLEEYETDAVTADNDLSAFLDKLKAAGLLD